MDPYSGRERLIDFLVEIAISLCCQFSSVWKILLLLEKSCCWEKMCSQSLCCGLKSETWPQAKQEEASLRAEIIADGQYVLPKEGHNCSLQYWEQISYLL